MTALVSQSPPFPAILRKCTVLPDHTTRGWAELWQEQAEREQRSSGRLRRSGCPGELLTAWVSEGTRGGGVWWWCGVCVCARAKMYGPAGGTMLLLLQHVCCKWEAENRVREVREWTAARSSSNLGKRLFAYFCCCSRSCNPLEEAAGSSSAVPGVALQLIFVHAPSRQVTAEDTMLCIVAE